MTVSQLEQLKLNKIAYLEGRAPYLAPEVTKSVLLEIDLINLYILNPSIDRKTKRKILNIQNEINKLNKGIIF